MGRDKKLSWDNLAQTPLLLAAMWLFSEGVRLQEKQPQTAALFIVLAALLLILRRVLDHVLL